jgi:hypothetical protein
LAKKKPPGFWRWRFVGFVLGSLAGPFRQQAEEVKEKAEEEPVAHAP